MIDRSLQGKGGKLPQKIPVKVPIIGGPKLPPCQLCRREVGPGESVMGFQTSRGLAVIHEGCFFGVLRWAYPKAHKHDKAAAVVRERAKKNGQPDGEGSTPDAPEA